MRDEQGDRARATQAFVKARALDLQAPPPDWSLSPEAFEHTVRRVIDTLPQRLRQTIRQDEIYVADMPGVEYVIDGVDPRALILMDDISPAGLQAPSARLFVYQRNLERLAGALESVESELRSALERELTAVLEENDPGDLTDSRKLLN
jgi:hypothetical protein